MKTEQTTLDRIRTRPRFKILTDLPPATVEMKLKQYLHLHQEEYGGNINKEVASICVKTETDSYWKPYLSIRSETEEGKTVVRGVFGPSSAVWTFFMFLYFLLSVLWMTFFTMWFVEKQIKSNEFPWALTASFVVLGVGVATYFAARYGQSKAKNEMARLRQFAIDAVLKYEIKN